MADLTGPFDGVPWSEAQWYRLAGTWSPSGVLGSPQTAITGGPFGVSSSGLTVTLTGPAQDSRAWLHGAGYEPEANKTVTVTANANATLSRRDRIVLRRDLAAKTILPVRLSGTASGTPTAPTITQDEEGIWDEPICSFLVPPASGTTLSGFLDERRWVDAHSGRRSRLFYATGTGTIATNTSAPSEVRITSAAFNKQAMLVAGNSYQVHVRGLFNSNLGGTTAQLHVRARTDTSTVTTGDTMVGTHPTTMPAQTGSTGRERARIDDEFTTSVTGVHSFALFLDASAGDLSFISDSRGVAEFWLEDKGPTSTGLISI